MTKKIMYGTYALQATVTFPDGSSHQQWFCSRCNRIWGKSDQHMASWCCCTHLICACGNEHEKTWTKCDQCRDKQEHEKWYAKPEVIWNGEWPLALYDCDKFFFGDAELLDYLHWAQIEGRESVIDDLRLTSCTSHKPRRFEVNDWCADAIGKDTEVIDSKSIDSRINEILAEIGVISFSANSDRLNVRDILDRIGFKSRDSGE